MTSDPGQRGDGLAMAFTAAEEACLAGQQRGRLATVAPDGTRLGWPGLHAWDMPVEEASQ